MKVLFLGNSPVGLYKFRREIIESIVKDHDVSFCVPNGLFVEEMVELGCDYYPCDLLDRHGTNPINELKLIHYYKSILSKIRPDIVFTYTIKPNVYGGLMCSKLKIPYVVNVTGLGTAVENSGLMQTITTFLYRIGLKNAQRIYFQNAENMSFMISRGINSNNCVLIPGSGVNTSQYAFCPYPRNDTVDFIFVARVMKEKGIDQYLEAASIIRDKYPETRFHVCGPCEQDYQDELQRLQNEGTIIYHGMVTDMMPIYQMSSCTVHPSYYPEGMSNVLLESAATGRPIITTNRSGCREIIDDGKNGFIVRQKDSADLVEKIEQFLSLSVDERAIMGQMGRQKVEKEFDRQIIVNAYLGELSAGRN